MSEFATARLNMVESQIRPNRVTDRRILDAMLEVPREKFVPASKRSLAYMDEEIVFESPDRASADRFMVAPMTLAQLTQLAGVEAGNVVLDVGCTTGYSSVILARLAGAVVGLECDAELSESASTNIIDLEADNAAIVTGDLAQGYPDEGPYDAIVLQGSVPEVAEALLRQLKEGGRLVAVIGDREMGQAFLYRKIGDDFPAVSAFDAGAPRLPGFEKAPEFVF